MKLTQTELVLVVLLIAYVSFFTHPPPLFVKQFFATPVGHALFLLALLGVAAYKSLIVGVFMGVAYIMTATSVTEYLDPTEQAPKAPVKPQPKASGIPAPVVADLLKDIMKKGDKPAHHAKAGKSVTAPPPASTQPKPASATNGIEKFSSF
jgi:hypothetical protein